MDEIVCRNFRNITSDYVNCLTILWKRKEIEDRDYKISFEFLIFDNNMQSALYITRNDTVDRMPIYYYKNVKELIYDMTLVEKKVIKHLDWKLINPIYLTAPKNVEKDLVQNPRKCGKGYLDHIKRGPSDHAMGSKKCPSQADFLLPSKKRVREFSQKG